MSCERREVLTEGARDRLYVQERPSYGTREFKTKYRSGSYTANKLVMTEEGLLHDRVGEPQKRTSRLLRNVRDSFGKEDAIGFEKRPPNRLASLGEDLKSFSRANDIEKLKEIKEDLSKARPSGLEQATRDLHEGILAATSRELKEAFGGAAVKKSTMKPDAVTIPEIDPGISARQAVEDQKAIASELIKILGDPQISAKEKAKRFVARLGVKIGSNAKAFAWTFAASFLRKHAYTIIKYLAMGAVSAALMAFLGPLLGGTSIGGLLGYAASTGVQGGWGLLMSGASNGLVSALPGLGLHLSAEVLKDSDAFAPYLNANLLRHPALQNLMSKLHVSEPYRTLTAMDILKNLIANLPLLLSPATIATGSMGLPDDPWTNFARSKGLQYLFEYGVPLVDRSYRSTKRLVVKMFDALSEVPGQAMEIIRNSEALRDSPVTKTETVLTGKRLGQDTPLARSEVVALVLPVIPEDVSDPAIKPILPRVAEEVLTKTLRTFDAEIEAQLRRDPPGEIALAAVRQRRTITRVEKEKSANIAWAASENLLESSAMISGAFVFGLLAARSASPETISKLLPEAFGETAKTVARKALISVQEHVSSEMLLYQLTSNVLGVPKLVQSLGKHLPEPARRRLNELDQQIGAATKGLANEKHPLVREFFSILIGRRIHSVDEMSAMDKETLARILEEAGTRFDPKKKLPSTSRLRHAVLQLQEQNVKEVHQTVFRAVLAQLSGAGAAIAVKNGVQLLQQGRRATEYVLTNENLRKTIGLTDLETNALKAQMTHPLENEPLMVTVPGTVKDAAKEVAEQNGSEWKAAISGAEKIEKFLGFAVPGQVTKEVLTREQQKEAMARSQGYASWGDYEKARRERIERRDARKKIDTDTDAADRLVDRAETLARLQERQKDRASDQARRDLEIRREELRDYISKNQQLKDLGFDEHLDKVFDMMKGQEVIQLFGQDIAKEGASKLLDRDLANALDIEMLPLVYYGMKKGLERVEAAVVDSATVASMPVLGAIIAGYHEAKRQFNSMADLYDAGLFATSAVGALLRSGTNENSRTGRLARMMPRGGKSDYMPRLKGMTEALLTDVAMKEFFDRQKINPLEVVSKAFFKHLIWGTTRAEMIGEIAAVMVAGKDAANAGALTGQAAGDAARLTADLLVKLSDYIPAIA
jgi:hypothetical protein